MSIIESEFEAWWMAQGQFCRAGGGDYEKTFAFRAYEAATERAAEVCEIQASSYAFIPDKYGEMACDDCAAAIRATTGRAVSA